MGQLDSALPECFWKRRFQAHWNEYGLDAAWSRWKKEAPVINESMIPLIENTIQELREWRFH